MTSEELDIRHIKLATGEEVLSSVLMSEGGVMVLSSPLRLHIIEKDDDYVYSFSPFMPLSIDGNVVLLLSNVVAFTYVTDSICEEYLQASGFYNEDSSSSEIDDRLSNETYSATLH